MCARTSKNSEALTKESDANTRAKITTTENQLRLCLPWQPPFYLYGFGSQIIFVYFFPSLALFHAFLHTTGSMAINYIRCRRYLPRIIYMTGSLLYYVHGWCGCSLALRSLLFLLRTVRRQSEMSAQNNLRIWRTSRIFAVFLISLVVCWAAVDGIIWTRLTWNDYQWFIDFNIIFRLLSINDGSGHNNAENR